MEEVIRFAVLGFGIGALYALASQGLIVIYRGSGVLNFAIGAIGMAGVFLQWDLHIQHHWRCDPKLRVDQTCHPTGDELLPEIIDDTDVLLSIQYRWRINLAKPQ